MVGFDNGRQEAVMVTPVYDVSAVISLLLAE
jgi:hypothetical protein